MGKEMEDDRLQLPPNWIKRQSKKRGIPYYYNTITKNSVWIHPAKMGVVDLAPSKVAHAIAQPLCNSPKVFGSPKSDAKQDNTIIPSPRPSERLKMKTPPERSSLHSIQASSHEIRRTPAQSRLNRLQIQLTAENAIKDALRLSETKTLEKASSERLIFPNQTLEKCKTFQVRPSETTMPTTNDSKSSVRPAKREVEFQIDDSLSNSKRLKLCRETNKSVYTEPINTPSVFSGLFDFAKSVFKTVTNSLSSESSVPTTSVTESSDQTLQSSNALKNLNPNGNALKACKSHSNFQSSLLTPTRVVSPTKANDRLLNLRDSLAKHQSNQQRGPIELQENCKTTEFERLDDDQAMLTDDEDTSNSNLTNDSDDESMDWDECLEVNNVDANINKSLSSSPQSGITIVLDTNVLIDHLQLVRSLAESTFEHLGRLPRLMVPYVVLQELDGQKQRKVVPVSTLAQTAIKYIHERLKTKDPRFLGQTSKANVSEPRIDVSTNDDRILNCALQCKDHSQAVTLMTNDINLRNLALMNDLQAMSAAEMKQWLSQHSIGQ